MRFACGRDKQVSRLTKCPIEKMRALKFTCDPHQKKRLAIVRLAQLVDQFIIQFTYKDSKNGYTFI
jgi:hypothetical protein